MKLCFNTDGLAKLPRLEMLDIVAGYGYEQVEFACGNWSTAPHVDLDGLLASESDRKAFLGDVSKRGMSLSCLNCSGNQLAPGAEGKEHQAVVEKTFRLAEMFGVNTIVMMSGCPGGSPEDTTPNWICASWPPITTKILEWQWNDVLIPYWEKTVKLAASHGIEKIALENHGYQMVYSPETLFRLRNKVGPMVGMNFDPSHLMWMGGDPIRAIRALGDAIHYVHAKDVRLERGACDINGALDTKTIDRFADRAWNFVALGHGHDLLWWKEFFSVLSMAGYDGTVSLEMEDLTMEPLAVLQKSTRVLKEALPREFK